MTKNSNNSTVSETDDLIGSFEIEEIEADVSDEVMIARPFDPNEIRVVSNVKTVDLIHRRIEQHEIELAPDFQRSLVWSAQKKCRLVESLLLRIPIPVFYVSADYDDNWSVVDGLQRLSTINSFLLGEFRLKNLEYLHELNGKKFKELPRNMQRRIEETELYFHVIQPKTPDPVKFNIFTRINTGGMPLTPQELRHALNPGNARQLLSDLVDMKSFHKATQFSGPDKRMSARESVLRFCAFYLTSWESYETNDFNGFLNEAMVQLNKMSPFDLENIAQHFDQSMTVCRHLFGEAAFRKPSKKNEARKPINKPLFETWSVCISKLDKYQTEYLVKNKRELIEIFHNTIEEDEYFYNSITISTGTPKNVSIRFIAVNTIIEETLGFLA